MKEETWKDIEGFNNYYEVSDLGRVRTKKTLRIKRLPIHWNGYRVVTLRMPGKNISKTKYIRA